MFSNAILCVSGATRTGSRASSVCWAAETTVAMAIAAAAERRSDLRVTGTSPVGYTSCKLLADWHCAVEPRVFLVRTPLCGSANHFSVERHCAEGIPGTQPQRQLAL